MSLGCSNITYKNCISDGDKNNWGDSFRIISGKGSSDSYPYITKVQFTTNSASDFYKSTKLVLQVTSRSSISNPHYLACNGYLSAKNYTQLSDIFDIDPNFLSAYGPGDALAANYLAKSPPCTDTSGTKSTSTSTTNGATFYFVFNTTSLKPSTTYYIYFIRDTSTYNGYFEADVESYSIEYTTTIALGSPTISTNLGIVAPTSETYKATISWNSVSNASSYSIYIKDSSGASIVSTKTVSETTYTLELANSVNYRGKGIIAYVRAVGSGRYTSSGYTNKTVFSINSLPTAPTVTKQSGSAVDTLTSIQFTVSVGTDTDGQTCSLYYSLDGVNKKAFTSPLTIKHTTTDGGGVEAGNNTINFYTWDGLEFSTGTPKTFTATFAPVIGTVTTTHTSIADMNNSTSTYLASAAKIQFTMSSGSPQTVKLYVRTGSSTSLSGDGSQVSSDLFTYNKDTQTINISSISAITAIANGAYYQFAFIVNDGITDSTLSDWSYCSVKRKPYLPRLPEYSNYNNHADNNWGATAKSNYYKDKVTISFSNPSASAGYAKISSVAITAIYSNTSKDYDFSYGSTSAELNLSQVNANVSTTFKFKITDVAGQTATSDIEISSGNKLTLIKSSSLTNGGNVVDVSNDNLKPMTNTESFLIYHPIAQASGTEAIVYKYNIKVGDNNTTLTVNDYTSVTTADQIQVTITAEKINSIAKTLVTDYNSAPKADIAVTAADGFGATLTLTKQITINFTEPPVFVATTPQFKIKHDYYTNNSIATTSMGTEITSSSNLNIRMINSGEGIIFVLPKASDPNDDIKEYQIYLARNDFTGTGNILGSEEVGYSQLLISISYDDVLKEGPQDDDYYYYRYTASTYSKNEYFYFKVRVADKTGNTSKDVICDDYIIGCRTVAPTFSAGNIRVDRNGEDVTLNYNFIVTDLGGSATKDGWDRDFYDDYPNFERTITGYAPQASLVIEIAPDQNFKDGETISNASNPIIFTPTGGVSQADFTSTTIKLSGFSASYTKIFMRFTLTVSYGLQNSTTRAYISSVPQVYTFFGSVPTVAHRAHKVGINTVTFDQDDVLVVENYQGTRYVRFKGTDASNAEKTYEITFDLLNGTITGAVLDCGEW